MATSDSSSDEPDWLIAKRGLKLLLNNDFQNAEELFLQYPDKLPIYAGHTFVVFMDALMAFENDKLEEAINLLKDIERKCTQDNSFFKMVRSRVFGKQPDEKTFAERMEMEIILADSQVLLAILMFLQQDLSGYIRSAWVLRKAWKIYQNSYRTMLNLFVDRFGSSHELPVTTEASRDNLRASGSLASTSSLNTSRKNSTTTNGYTLKPIPNSYSAILHHNNTDDCSPNSSGNSTPNSMQNNYSRNKTTTFLNKSQSVNSALYQQQQQQWNSKLTLPLNYFTSNFQIFSSSSSTPELDISDENLERLMGAVCFGYGLLNLGISLLPPGLLKLTNFLGFTTNRSNGIQCLMFSRKGIDMRAPLATLSLLWYHTIVRPFYAIDGTNVQAGVDAASVLLDESEQEYGESALFLLFKGRVRRLNSDIPAALHCYQLSVEKTQQREVRLLAMHEVGWCYLIQLDYISAEMTFKNLKLSSRWSKNFYCYNELICAGCCGHITNANDLKKCIGLKSFNKNNPIEEFLMKRSLLLPDDDRCGQVVFWRLLVYEMLYLWNCLSSCNTSNIQFIVEDCENVNNVSNVEPMLGLSKLILGSCKCIQNNFTPAMHLFRECIEIRKHLPINSNDCHISAFAFYELGYILIKSPETKEEGKALLQQVYRYKGYDFENRLVLRVHSVLNHY